MNRSTPKANTKETITNRFSWIKEYLKPENITIFTLLMYVWGYIYYYQYYNSFGINIIKYISLQELLVETLIYISLLAIISTIIIVILYYLVLFAFLIRKENRAKRYVAIRRGVSHSFIYVLFDIIFIFTAVIIIFIIELLLDSGYTFLHLDRIILIKYFYPAVSILTIYSASNLYKNRKNRIFTYIVTIYIIGYLLLTTNSLARSNAEYSLLKEQNKTRNVETSTGQKYITNDTLLYIGETNSTLFLFNKPANNTIIINKENVVQTTLIKHATIKLRE